MKQFSEEDVLKELQFQLKRFYQDNATLRNPILDDDQHEQDLASCFVNVALVEEKERKFTQPTGENSDKEKNPYHQNTFHDARLHSYEHIFNVKEALPLHNLFKPGRDTNDTPPKRIIIAGQAGIGKSVLCRYLAFAWAKSAKELKETLSVTQASLLISLQQSLLDFDYVFVIRLREIPIEEINPKKMWHSLVEIILSQTLSQYEFSEQIEHIDTILQHLKSLQSKMLILLDGYDEIVSRLKNQYNQDTPLKKFIDFLLSKEASWSVIITSRPIASQNLKGNRHLELIGFLDPQIEEFVKQRVTEKEQAERCLAFLKSTPSIWGTAHIPLNLTLLVQFYQGPTFKPPSQHVTLTWLYDQLVIHLAKKYLYKKMSQPLSLLDANENADYQILGQSRFILGFLESLALSALIDPNANKAIILSQEFVTQVKTQYEIQWSSLHPDSRETVHLDEICRFGLLHPTTRLDAASKADYFFCHLTFQEFFAARAMAHALWQDIPNGALINPDSDRKVNTPQHKHFDPFKPLHVLSLVNLEKYNLQFYIVWQFLSGLLHDNRRVDEHSVTMIQREKAIRSFWNAIDQTPRAFHPLYHNCLIVRLLDEAVDEKILDERGYPLSHRWNEIKMSVLAMDLQIAQQEDTYIISSYRDHPLFITLSRHPKALQRLSLIEKLLDRLNTSEEFSIIISAMLALGELGPHLDHVLLNKIVQAISRHLSNTVDLFVCSCCVHTLSLLGPYLEYHQLEIILHFFKLKIKENKDEMLRSEIMKGFSKIGHFLESQTLHNVTHFLIEKLERDNDITIRTEAIRTIRLLSTQLPPELILLVMQTLIECREHEKYNNIRAQATQTLITMCPLFKAEWLDALLPRIPVKHYHRENNHLLFILGPFLKPEGLSRIIRNLIATFLNACDHYSRKYAVQAFAELGAFVLPEEVDRVVQTLNEQLVHEGDILVREQIVQSLGTLASYVTPERLNTIVQALSLMLVTDNDPRVCAHTVQALSSLGHLLTYPELEKIIQVLLQQVKENNNKYVLAETIRAFGTLGPFLNRESLDSIADSIFLQLAHTVDDNIYSRAIATICILVPLIKGEGLEKTIHELSRLVNHEKSNIQREAAQALGTLGNFMTFERLKTVIQDLIHHLTSNIQPETRLEMAKVLLALAPHSQSEDLDTIVQGFSQQLTREQHPYFRAQWAEFLGDLAPFLNLCGLDLTLQTLFHQFQYDDDFRVRTNVVDNIIRLCPFLEPHRINTILHILIQRLGFESESVREGIIETLSILSPLLETDVLATMLHTLTEHLTHDSEASVRRKVAEIFITIGPLLKSEGLDTIIQALTQRLIFDNHDDVREEVIKTLVALCPYASLKTRHALLQVFIHQLQKDENSAVRADVAQALGNLGSEQPFDELDQIIQALFQRRVQDKEDHVRDNAAESINALSQYYLSALFSLYVINPSKQSCLLVQWLRNNQRLPLSLWHNNSLWALSPVGIYCYHPTPVFFPWSSFTAYIQGSILLSKEMKSFSEKFHSDFCPQGYFDCFRFNECSLLDSINKYNNTLAVIRVLTTGWFGEQRHSTFGFKLTSERVAKIFGYLDLPALFAASFVCKAWHAVLHYHPRYCLFSTQFKDSYVDCVLLKDETSPSYQQLTPPIPVRTILYFAASHSLSELPLDHEKEIRPLSQLFHNHKHFKLISNLDDTEPATQASLTDGVVKGSLQQLINILAYLKLQQPLWMIHLSMHGRIKEDNSDNQLCFVNAEGDDWVDSTTVNQNIIGCFPLPIALLLISACESKKTILTRTLTCAEQVMGTEDHDPQFEHAIRWAWEFYRLLMSQARPVQVVPASFQEAINNRAKNGTLQMCKLQFFCAPTFRTKGSMTANDQDEQQPEDLTTEATLAKKSSLTSMSGK